MKKETVIRISKFHSNEMGHGGEKRTAQITDILDSNDINIVEFKDFLLESTRKSRMLYFFFLGLGVFIRHKRFKLTKKRIKDVVDFGCSRFSIKKFLKENKILNIKVLIFEETTPKKWFVPFLAKENSLKIFALPHNLESLVSGEKSYKNPSKVSPDWFLEELEVLGWCDKVFTISKEEQWLLTLQLKKEVFYLPFYPANKTQKYLLGIREQRANKVQFANHILVLGSAINPPTLLGMKALKKFVQDEKLSEFNFYFVGFGMNKILDPNEQLPSNIQILDGVSSEVLQSFLVNTKLVLVYQAPTSGVLTRMLELLFAGIPILSNSMGSRTFYNKPGIYTFEELKEIPLCLSKISNALPMIPEREFKLEEIFISNINN